MTTEAPRKRLFGKKSWLLGLGVGVFLTVVFLRMIIPPDILSYALGLLTGNPWFLVLVNIPGGLAFGAEDTSIATYALDCSTEETKARYYSILLTVGGMCAFAGSLFSGLIMDVWLTIAGIDYNSPDFNVILFIMLIMIATLRLVTASFHRFIYSNPLDFELDQLTSQ